MADANSQALTVYTDAIRQASATWKSAYQGSGISDIDVESAFSALVNAGVATAYVPSLKKALSKAENSVLQTIKTLETLSNEQEGTDNNWNNNASNYTGGNRRTPSGGTTTSGTPTGTTDPSETTKKTDKEVSVNTDFIDKVKDLSVEDYSTLMTALGSVKNDELLSYLVDPDQATKLKEYLLKEVNLPKDLKQAVSEMDENELQLTLMSLLTDEATIPDLSKDVVYRYTEELSKRGDLSVSEMSTYFYYNVDTFSDVIDAALAGDTQQILVDIYQGNEVTDDTLGKLINKDLSSTDPSVAAIAKSQSEAVIDFVRSSVDKICEKNNTNYETLLTDSSKKGILEEGLNDISKGLSYFKAVSSLGSEASEILFKSFVLKDSSDGTTTGTSS